MIVTAEHGDAQTMRLAMQAGARDFLPGALNTQDLIASIDRAAAQIAKAAGRAFGEPHRRRQRERRQRRHVRREQPRLHHEPCRGSRRRSLSLDMQFESLAPYFDVTMKHGLMEVLEGADELDAVALDAYMTQHAAACACSHATPDNSFEQPTTARPSSRRCSTK